MIKYKIRKDQGDKTMGKLRFGLVGCRIVKKYAEAVEYNSGNQEIWK